MWPRRVEIAPRAHKAAATGVTQVRITVKDNGALMVHCNDIFQVCWDAAGVDTSRPLYAVVGMRAPACGIALRTRETDLIQHADCLPPSRTITLRGIGGRTDETIDLTKHGRPKYPAAFTNVRAISDIASLYPLLLQPYAGREHGRKGATPMLIRAGPGVAAAGLDTLGHEGACCRAVLSHVRHSYVA